MNNFDWTNFTRRVAVKSTVAKMYDAWTKSSEIEKWFLRNADFIDQNQNVIDKNSNVQTGMTYKWNWFLYEPSEFGKIIEANGKDFLQFTFAQGCLVDIKLSELNDHVVVELTQKNIPEDDDSKVNIRLGCDNGWSFYLVNLKSVYEGGLDLRNKDVSFRGVVNH